MEKETGKRKGIDMGNEKGNKEGKGKSKKLQEMERKTKSIC